MAGYSISKGCGRRVSKNTTETLFCVAAPARLSRISTGDHDPRKLRLPVSGNLTHHRRCGSTQSLNLHVPVHKQRRNRYFAELTRYGARSAGRPSLGPRARKPAGLRPGCRPWPGRAAGAEHRNRAGERGRAERMEKPARSAGAEPHGVASSCRFYGLLWAFNAKLCRT